ncbi:MAG: class I SAM-dependent methyltransferase [Alphaproteobacteria bacterium]|nr:class I SAM-dependent methyltransferase [Alphaproteobacteria bacterium]
MSVRPEEELYGGLPAPAGPGYLPAAGDPHWQRALAFFADYPAASLLSPAARAYLYWLLRRRRARVALEIGTYLAGTSEILARALAAEGGRLATIDLNLERDRQVRETIGTWPAGLSAAVDYFNIDSARYFGALEDRGDMRFDLVLVDGYHEYGYALFDMVMAAKYMAPGGAMVIDDGILPAVWWAARDFLDSHPGWSAVGPAMEQAPPLAPLRPSLADTTFIVLTAPATVVVGARPRAFHYAQLAGRGVRGFEFLPMPGQAPGRIEGVAILRASRPLPSHPEQQTLRLAIDLSGDVPTVLPCLLAVERPAARLDVELQLTYSGPGLLRLRAEPEAIIQA